ncbi:MAG: response regulator [Bacteroidetes bacterium]|nr:MAG: response regulator [Bacteroidota bacterium]
MNVLIVDDSTTMRMLVKRILRMAGFTGLKLVEADNGIEALEVVASESPNLVLSDWNMPEMNGLEFLTELRESGNDVKFGFVTTESTSEMRLKAKDAGAQFLIAKPFTPESFEQALRPVLG